MGKDVLIDGHEDLLKDMEDPKDCNVVVAGALDIFGFFMSILSFVVFFIFFVARSVFVEGPSMNNTLYEKDCLIINKVNSIFPLKPKRKDVVVLNGVGIKGCDAFIVKRVIAIEDDVVEIKNFNVYVNGEKLKEDYALGRTYPTDVFKYPLKIPKGFIFYLGDNRENSSDSRHFGLMPIDRIVGRVFLRCLPLRRFSFL